MTNDLLGPAGWSDPEGNGCEACGEGIAVTGPSGCANPQDSPTGGAGPRDESLDRLADLFAAIEAAREYGFAVPPAMEAAADRLGGLDRDSAVAVAAALAAFVAVELSPRGGVGLDWWAQHWQYAIAMRDRP